jgi:hypothetical protein
MFLSPTFAIDLKSRVSCLLLASGSGYNPARLS